VKESVVVEEEIQEVAEGEELSEIAEEVEVKPEPVAVDPNRPLRRKK
jgi:sulfur carrier protein ThiS